MRLHEHVITDTNLVCMHIYIYLYLYLFLHLFVYIYVHICICRYVSETPTLPDGEPEKQAIDLRVLKPRSTGAGVTARLARPQPRTPERPGFKAQNPRTPYRIVTAKGSTVDKSLRDMEPQ